MAIYNVFDILERITEVIDDGFFCVEVSESEADDEFPACLFFTGLGDDSASEGYDIEAIDYDYETPPQTFEISSDSPCYILTLEETSTVLHALNNALEYIKECSLNKDGSYDRAALDDMKRSSVKLRNLQGKIKKLLRHN